MAPYHFLGPRLGPRVYERFHGKPRKHAYGETLWAVHVGPMLRFVRGLPGVEIERVEPRYWPRLAFIARIPLVRELLMWNCVIRMRKLRLSRRRQQQPGRPSRQSTASSGDPVGADQVVGIAELVAAAVARGEHEVDQRERARCSAAAARQQPAHVDARAQREHGERREHRTGAQREQEAAGEPDRDAGGERPAPGEAHERVGRGGVGRASGRAPCPAASRAGRARSRCARARAPAQQRHQPAARASPAPPRAESRYGGVREPLRPRTRSARVAQPAGARQPLAKPSIGSGVAEVALVAVAAGAVRVPALRPALGEHEPGRPAEREPHAVATAVPALARVEHARRARWQPRGRRARRRRAARDRRGRPRRAATSHVDVARRQRHWPAAAQPQRATRVELLERCRSTRGRPLRGTP